MKTPFHISQSTNVMTEDMKRTEDITVVRDASLTEEEINRIDESAIKQLKLMPLESNNPFIPVSYKEYEGSVYLIRALNCSTGKIKTALPVVSCDMEEGLLLAKYYKKLLA